MSNSPAREHWEWVQNLNSPCICTTCEVMPQLLELEATLQRVRDARANHPEIPECDRYTDEDEERCGWRWAIESIDWALGDTK